ncbi:MAG: Flp pilus assembly complex ATPase component TadA [Kiritimatiellae bacterium]|nr:Flp pilus assembly complex ATPase component TadA [Kiritimatiellia bacterium]
MPKPVKLKIVKPGEPDRVFDIAPGTWSIGSDKDNRIVLPGREVSWRHAVLSVLAEGIWVEDLVSSFGTYIDGRRVEGRVPLGPGQELRVGLYVLVALPDGEQPKPEPEAPAPKPAAAPAPAAPAAAPEAFALKVTDTPLGAAERKGDERRRVIKRQIHDELLKRLDIRRLTANRVEEADLKRRARTTIDQIIGEVAKRLPPEMEPTALAKEIYDEAVGLGPLEDLLADAEVTEIMVNGPDQVYVERAGKLHLTAKTFVDENSVHAVIERIVAPIGRRIDESQPYVDARLPDGSRVNAIIHPLSLSGPCITIRKFSKEPFTVEDLVGFGTLPPLMAEFIRGCVLARKNIVISGGTGSGKTTLLNVVSSYLPQQERIVTIEDAAELRLTQAHVIRLEARPPNIEGRGAVTVRDLVRNALRMRPDRIVVGECRGGEALDMLQAMNTGHEGSLTTVHANSPRDVISRLETMVLMAGMELPLRAIREQIGSAIHLIVHLARLSDGSRKIVRVAEVVGLEMDKITMQDLFAFKQRGIGPDGKVLGEFGPTGSVPTFIEEFKANGITLPTAVFDVERWKPD